MNKGRIRCFECPYVKSSKSLVGLSGEHYYWYAKDALPGAGYQSLSEINGKVAYPESTLKTFWEKRRICVYWRDFGFERWFGRIIPLCVSFLALFVAITSLVVELDGSVENLCISPIF